MKVVYNTAYGGFSISKTCAEWMADRGNKECMDLLRQENFGGYLYETPRHDALLNLAIEELGIKQCGDALATHELRGDRYFIDDYDGMEKIVEPHDIRWVIV